MSRNKKPVETGIEIEHDEASLARAESAATELAQMSAGYAQERDLVNQLLGQAQMAGAFEEFSRTVRTSKLAYVKEHKLYRAIRGMKTPNGSEFSGTWGEFCELIGMSPDKADLDIANLNAFGEAALESMSRMGIGYRELRQYRRLGADQQQALIAAAQAGDKGEFLDLAEELIAKSAKEKESLAKALEEERADHQATRDVLDKKVGRISQLEREKARIAAAPPDERLAEDLKALSIRATEAIVTVRAGLRAGFKVLLDREMESEDAPSTRHVMAGYLDELEREIAILRQDFHLRAIAAA